MPDHAHHRLHPLLAALAGSTLLLAACGGGSSDHATPASPTTVRGVAASGGAIAGASVTLVDADGATVDPAAVSTAADGSFSIDASGLHAPFSLRISFTQDGVPRTLYSVLPTVTAGTANTANITPLTDAVAVLVAPGGNPAALMDPAALAAALGGANANAFANAVATLNAVLASDPAIAATLAAAAGTGNSFNPVTTSFSANGTGVDAVIDQLSITTNPSGAAAGTVQIQNNAQAPGAGGAAPPVSVTPATTPATAPTLPPTASGDLPSAADLDALAARTTACYALPAAQRVTATDADGVATAIAAACAADVSDFISNGYTWLQSQSDALQNANLDGAKFQRPLVLLVLPAQNRSGKEFQHPYCNQAQCVVVDMRATLPAANNQPIRRTLLLAKVGGSWKSVGNQRPYDFDVTLRGHRYVNRNAAPANPASYFSLSRYEGVLRTFLNPSGPNMNGVRAARVSGPGLPAAGLVLSRSSRCSSDRMVIASKTGDTYVVENGVNQPRYWTGNASMDFKFGAAMLDGSDIPAAAWPLANVDYADSANAGGVAPYGEYKWEFFFFGSATPAEPDQIVYQRLIVSDTALQRYVNDAPNWWPTLAPANVAAYLSPTGSGAGALTDLSVSWTVPALLGRVDGVYLFGQNNAVVNGASYNKRTILVAGIAKPGDTTASVTAGQSPWLSGVSTSSFTSGIAAAQNPRCSEADKSLVPLAGVAGDYRELGLGTTLTNGVRLSSIDYWQL
ncbi:MAG: hypothetical protein JSR75_17110 [Proteobacteria bacterium]|nr:hypothetical protein [Pseudomonadota bacterium]